MASVNVLFRTQGYKSEDKNIPLFTLSAIKALMPTSTQVSGSKSSTGTIKSLSNPVRLIFFPPPSKTMKSNKNYLLSASLLTVLP